MRPLQIWLPFLNSRLSDARAKRDCQRAFEAWSGEVTVWLLPEIDKTIRWHEAPWRRAVAIPAERLERIDVYHAGSNGYVVGRAAGSLFPNPIESLLDAWLNCLLASVEFYYPPETVIFDVPSISKKGVRYKQIELVPVPYGMIPIAKVVEATGTVQGHWPPKSLHFGTVSPDAESAEVYGPFERADVDGVATGASMKTGSRTLFRFANWPSPWDALVPAADGVDVFLGHAKMRMIARQSETDREAAISRAKAEASAYVFDGTTSREWAWFWPTCLGDGEEAALFGAEDLGFQGQSLADLSRNTLFCRMMTERVDVRRVWGPLGLFWALLLARLEDHRRFSSCQNCGRILKGKRGKRLCGWQDNPDCYAKRRAADQRRSRTRRGQKLNE